MTSNIELAHKAYAAFGAGDLATLVGLCATDVDWKHIGPEKVAYMGQKHGHQGVRDFFAALATADNIQEFAPQEFIDGGDHVTVLGREKTTATETGKTFESEWIHVFTFKAGKVCRWRGWYDTAARYG